LTVLGKGGKSYALKSLHTSEDLLWHYTNGHKKRALKERVLQYAFTFLYGLI